MPNNIFIVSKDLERQSALKKLLTIAFPNIQVDGVHQITLLKGALHSHRDIVIYDSLTCGCISSKSISLLGGCWLNITNKKDDMTQMQSLIDGFSANVSATDPIDHLPRIIRHLLLGQIWYSRNVIAFAIRQYQAQSLTSEEMVEFAISNLQLTQREKELARLLVRGQTNQDIADQLCISIHTVKTHVSRILNKLGLHSRNELHLVLSHSQLESSANSIE